IDRPKSQLIYRALEEYLEDYEDYLIPLGRLNDKNHKIVSGKDSRKSIDLLDRVQILGLARSERTG
ncbi:MAG TPA: hypothetical protein VED17_04125, partial [Nitrososphaerales archaeon]|nr:hypothetical protein [Nitrososphaerales archaeon]